MKLQEHFSRAGEFLFRWRGHLPLLLLPLVLLSLRDFGYPGGSQGLYRVWEFICFGVSMMGVALRVWVSGTVPEGTSGRNRRGQRADSLNTSGAYSVLRHPLYLGNALIALGVALFTRTWYLPVIVLLSCLLFYERIAFREEEFLEGKFGKEFRSWADRTPAVLPNLKAYRSPSLPFSWRSALRKEFYAISEVVFVFSVLDLLARSSAEGRVRTDPLWGALGSAAVVFYISLRFLKKRTAALDVNPQARR
ncbi:MAG TPA: hypothetical protein EYP61_09200 [Candidatus Latescibacteria bacterium]|nr:hypothetical protein [Candidatus Latescibacterota bacterium]